MSISRQFVTMVLVSILAVFLCTCLVCYWNLKGIMMADYKEGLDNKSISVSKYVNMQLDSYEKSCYAFARRPICGNLLETEDKDTILDGFKSINKPVDVSNILFADYDGEFIADLNNAYVGFSHWHNQLLEQAFDGKYPPIMLCTTANGASFLHIVPAGDLSDPIGHLLFERPIDKSYISELGNVFDTNVLLVHNNEVRVNSMDALVHLKKQGAEKFETTDERYMISGFALDYEGDEHHLLLASDTEVIQAHITEVLWQMLLFSAIATVAILVLVLYLVKRIRISIQAMLTDLSGSISELYAISANAQHSSEQINKGIKDQVGSIAKISGYLNDLVESAEQNRREADDAQNLLNVIGEVVSAGEESAEHMSSTVTQIESSTFQISDVLKTLEAIAFQTNILALNASVEAARAGESGHGFAVVAEEVRSLAMRSAEAANETSDLIDGAQGNSREGVDASQNVLEKVNAIKEHMATIVAQFKRINDASQQQRYHVKNIDEYAHEIKISSDKNASFSDETQSMSRQLTHYANLLQTSSEKIAQAIIG